MYEVTAMFYMHVHCILIKKYIYLQNWLLLYLALQPSFTCIYPGGVSWNLFYSYVLTAVEFTILFAESATNIDVPHTHWFFYLSGGRK